MAFAAPASIIASIDMHDGQDVADFGAGAGYYTNAAAQRVGDDGRVFAIDIQQELLTKARGLDSERRDWIEYIHGDLEEPKGSQLAEKSVDWVILANTLFQIEHKDVVLAEAARILRGGGKLLLVDWSDSFGGLGPVPDHVISAGEARELAEAAGFTYVRDVDAGDHHWGMVLTLAKKH